MNRKIHLILILGCIIIAALDAPRASRLFTEGLSGPYARAQEEPVKPKLARPNPASVSRSPRTEAERNAKTILLDSSIQLQEGEPSAR